MLYSSSKVQPISLDNILNRLTEYDIYAYYLGANFKVGTRFNSPWRRDDNPSFGIFRSDNGSLLYKDLGTGDAGNCVSFVQKMLDLPQSKHGYVLAIEKIYEDMLANGRGLPAGNLNLSVLNRTKRVNGDRAPISVKRMQWSQKDIDFWSSFHIPIKTLTKFEVYPIQYVFINDLISWTYTDDQPMYVYKVYNGLKIYRPFGSKEDKWLSNCTRYDIQGLKQLPESGDLLIITKSMKDVMVLHELGYPAVAPHSETQEFPETILTHLRERFKNIIVFFDRDKTGIAGTRKLVRKHDLDFIFIPKKYKVKDISDFVKKYSMTNGNKLLTKLINGRKSK